MAPFSSVQDQQKQRAIGATSLIERAVEEVARVRETIVNEQDQASMASAPFVALNRNQCNELRSQLTSAISMLSEASAELGGKSNPPHVEFAAAATDGANDVVYDEGGESV